MRTLTFEIKKEECVGDSVGKHNYNIMSLDTVLCNLSSEIFNVNDNIITWFNEISTLKPRYDQMAQNFSNTSSFEYKVAHTTINLLSSYWNTSELTIQYPYNLYANDGQKINGYTSTTPLSVLMNTATSYLSSNFIASSYNVNSRANVVMFLHNTLDTTILTNTVSIPTIYGTLSTIGTSTGSNGSTPAGGALAQLGLLALDDYSRNNPRLFYNTGSNTYSIITDPANTTVPLYYKTVKVDFFKQDVHLKNACMIRFKRGLVKTKPQWIPTDILMSDPNLSSSTITNAITAFNK